MSWAAAVIPSSRAHNVLGLIPLSERVVSRKVASRHQTEGDQDGFTPSWSTVLNASLRTEGIHAN
jgi:hypothetical protein